jgi:hypothetical protein
MNGTRLVQMSITLERLHFVAKTPNNKTRQKIKVIILMVM